MIFYKKRTFYEDNDIIIIFLRREFIMNEKSKDLSITFAVFVGAIIIGGIYIERSHHGYTEAALLYLSGVLAAGLFWIGRK